MCFSSGCCFCFGNTCYSIMILRILSEATFLGLLIALVIFYKNIDNLIDKSLVLEITFKKDILNFKSLENSDFCTNYRNKYLNDTINLISDVAYFKENYEEFQNKLNISKIFLIIVLVLSFISVLNSICSTILYEFSLSGDSEDECGNCCFIIILIKFFIFLIFGTIYLCLFFIFENKFKSEFFNNFINFFISCDIVKVDNQLFKDLNYYINKSVLFIIIGFSIKIFANIIFLTEEICKYKHDGHVSHIECIDKIFFCCKKIEYDISPYGNEIITGVNYY